MIQFFTQGGIFLNNNLIGNEPGAIIGPISTVLGWIINFIYDIWSFVFTPAGALGVSIIIMTIIVRMALFPTQFKMMSNTMKMRAMKPEMDKIKEKYGNSKDPELRRKMSAEMQALNQKHGVNMLASCLPMLITWPLFIGLFRVLDQAFLFVGNVEYAYTALSMAIIDLGPEFISDIIGPIAVNRTPVGTAIFLDAAADMNRLIHVFSDTDWNTLFSNISGQQLANIQYLYDQKVSIQTFLTLNLIAPAGTNWPGVMLPLLSATTMLLSQYLMMRTNPPMDDQAKMMQKVMLLIFPLMFGWFTIMAPAGVGLYWVMLNVVMIGQHQFIHRYYIRKAEKAKDEKVR
ncbi:MAG: YidC/Oxa1 family membrane protein insertase [Defluviitaleaceae bacterium]|nr:YidC/Oxa1 family membrane protein insertase [Defluviitaleaceae bacterium]